MYDLHVDAVLFVCSAGTHAEINNGYRLFTLCIQILCTNPRDFSYRGRTSVYEL